MTKRCSIGWREWASLPDWGIPDLRAKIDTGAKTCAVDVAEIEEIEGGLIRFRVVESSRPSRTSPWITARPTRVADVKPSSGIAVPRYICTTRLRLGPVEAEVEVGLVSRRGMQCRMLIGRTAMAGRFMIDPSRKYILTSRRQAPSRGEDE